MNSLTDQQLLRDYAGRRSEAAFAELVRRHVDFVFSAALRMVREAPLAEDVTQGVFVALARQTGQLQDRPVLSGWLHRTTQNLAANAVRSEVRRHAREQEAAAMNELLAPGPDPVWEHIAPHLDAALGELNEADREALLLRYFERKSAREMAPILGTSEEAAQKRVNRAVERLRELFAKRGVTVGAGGLAVVISAHAVQAAPAGLAVTISTAAALAGTSIAATATAAVTKAIVMTTLQKTAITAIIAVVVGAGIYEARQASNLRTQVQTLQRQQAPLNQGTNQPPVVAKIIVTHIQHPRALSEEQIRTNILIKVGDVFNRAALDLDVRNLYASGLFYNLRVADTATDEGIVLNYMVQEKPKLTRIRFTGNSRYEEADLANILASKVGEPFDQRMLGEDVRRIRELYQAAGFAGTKVKCDANVNESIGEGDAIFDIVE